MTLTFIELYDAAKGKPHSTAKARERLVALQSVHVHVTDLIALRAVMQRLGPGHTYTKSGALVVSVLKASTSKAIAALVSLIAPKAWPARMTEEQVQNRTANLYADCFLALDRWQQETR